MDVSKIIDPRGLLMKHYLLSKSKGDLWKGLQSVSFKVWWLLKLSANVGKTEGEGKPC